jgi:serine/threonine-protein kinase
MGRLYLAERMGIEGFVKVVALKRILPHLADSAQFRDMFLNETRVAARLEHPNIVATYELGEVNGTYFLSMEYLPGEDLAAILARSPVAPAAGSRGWSTATSIRSTSS